MKIKNNCKKVVLVLYVLIGEKDTASVSRIPIKYTIIITSHLLKKSSPSSLIHMIIVVLCGIPGFVIAQFIYSFCFYITSPHCC